MIRHLRGLVHGVDGAALVVDVGGVGLAVQCTPATAASVHAGEHIEMLTSFVVREDGWALYGFLDGAERDLFDIVQTVSGIGPRIALTLLSTLTPHEVRAAIGAEDLATLTKVPGIGRKGAQRMVLELKDKVGIVGGAKEPSGVELTGWRGSVKAGLVSLGWTTALADEAVAALPEPDGEPDIAALLKAALVGLDRR